MLWDESQDDLILGGAARLGIGTTSPSAKVHLNGPSAGFSEILRLQRDGGNYYSIGLDNNDLNFCYNGQSADGSTLVIDGATSRIGIGTKAPSSLLEVRGAAGAAGILTLSTAETTVVDGDELGRINFSAPLESDGTDSILVAASIYAEADDTFDASTNDTDLVFATGASETATEKFRIDSSGDLHMLSGQKLHTYAGGANWINYNNIQMSSGSALTVNNAGSGGLAFQTGGTTRLAIDQNGVVTVGVDDTGYDVKFFGATSGMYLLWDESANALTGVYDLKLADSREVQLGDGNDLRLYHSHPNSYIKCNQGDLVIQNDADDIKILAEDDVVIRDNDDSTEMAKFINGGAVELYHNGSKKFETTSSGATVTGGLTTTAVSTIGGSLDIEGELNLTGNGNKNFDVFTLANSNTLTIRHHNPSGNLFETAAVFTANAGAELYYDHSKKFETTSAGATVTGNLTVSADLIINGTTTTVNSTTVTIDDPVFTLGGDSAPSTDDNKDRGIEFRYHNGSAAKIGFFGWDDSASVFTFIADASPLSEVYSGSAGNVAFGMTSITGGGTTSPSGVNGLHLMFDSSSATSWIKSEQNGTSNRHLGFHAASYTFNTGASTFNAAITVGVDDTGHDVKFFGATAGSYLMWDESQDRLRLTDSTPMTFGDGDDLRIEHDGSNSYITEQGQNDLYIQPNEASLYVRNAFSGKMMLTAKSGSGHIVELYGNNVKRLATDSSGVNITGELNVGVDDTGHDVKFFGDTAGSFMLWDASQDRLELTDDSRIVFGDGADASIWHGGTDTYIENGTGDLVIRNQADDKDIIFSADAGGTLAEIMRIDGSTGRVGIGVTAPEALLHVKAADSVTGVLKIEGGKDTVTSVGEINSEIQFGSNDPSVSSTGNVGGKISSVTEYNNGAWVGLAFYTYHQTTSDLAERVRIAKDGKVGIGVTSPSSQLHVETADNEVARFKSTDEDAQIALQDNTDTCYISHDASADIMQLGFNSTIGSTDNLSIDTSGRVGIGYASPSHKLHVRAEADGDWVSRITNTEATAGANYGLKIDGGSNASDVALEVSSLAGTHLFEVRGDGNVGIGTTSPVGKLTIVDTTSSSTVQKFHVGRATNAGLYITDTDNSSYIKAIQDEDEAGYGNLILAADSAGSKDGFISFESEGEKMRITADGKVGIGTTSPAQKLDVRGIAKIGDSASNGHLIGRKDYSVTESFSTGLTVTLADNTACHVKVFISGDWSGHSSIAYVGEFFIQNAANSGSYNEPGIILTEHDNLASDGILSQIVDGTGDSFTIQFRANTSSSTSVSGRLCYHIMGDATAVS